jgi:sterol desaturase/sphingolipid hydroxylase (fatty acid hydroxylase superfamily)
MQLSKTAYYADFAIYAAAVGALFSGAALGGDWADRDKWLTAFAVGMAVWTLIEYVLHRFVLHRVPVIAPMHDDHHHSPRAYIGTPTWVTLTLFVTVVFLPAWRGISFNVASGLTAGVMAGFFWYGVLHHTIHHGRPRALASRVRNIAHRHMRHHYSRREGNFGVTTGLWDWLFRTSLAAPRSGRSLWRFSWGRGAEHTGGRQ